MLQIEELKKLYIESCNYPGVLNCAEIEKNLKKYVEFLGIRRNIIQLKRDWNVFSYEDILENEYGVLDKIVSRAAQDAQDARDTQEKINKFSRFIINGFSYGWWDLSWVVTTWFGSENKENLKWSYFLLQVFLNGCWFLYWTKNSLYWFAKPTCKTFSQNNRKIFHCDNGPALISDWQDLYFLNGVLVDEKIVMTKSENLDPSVITKTTNAEVRKEIVRKIGVERVCQKLNAKVIDKQGDIYELLNLDLGENRIRPYLKMRNPSIGTYHIEGVAPGCKTIEQALNWRNQMKENPEILT